jgi:hypothetical protein
MWCAVGAARVRTGVRESVHAGQVGGTRTQAAACTGERAWTLSDQELLGSLDAAHRVSVRVAAVQAHLVGEIDRRGLTAPASRPAV